MTLELGDPRPSYCEDTMVTTAPLSLMCTSSKYLTWTTLTYIRPIFVQSSSVRIKCNFVLLDLRPKYKSQPLFSKCYYCH